MEILELKLKNLGLNEKDAQVYLAILKMRQTTPTEIAQMTGIKRTTVHHCLDSLIKMELINKIIDDSGKHYFADNPEESLKNVIREKERNIREMIPELKNLYGTGSAHPGIRIYQKEEGLRRIFNDVLNCQDKTVRYYSSDLDIDKMLGEEFLREFVQNRIEKGIRSLSLRSFKYKPEREQRTTHAKQLREVKFLPDDIEIAPYMCIYDDKVVSISAGEQKVGFIIQSKEFAEAQKIIFDMLWNTIAI